jgi:flagellar biosynthesis protein FlhG
MNPVPNGGQKTIWAIGGGKGGSGKSFIAANIGICLSKLGIRVILIDADLGGQTFTLLGIPTSLADFLKRVPRLQDVLIPTVIPNLQLLSALKICSMRQMKTFKG